ncbi:pancreatic triacylglycerol lipase-like [Plodia interpunctella]|uniref:pancreatic triacylglycerol lipase-like n=1 Tax=Plodia interpunctella TaxID=58824 RepID=UPI0023685257|nr:pancreatic triacylglycerol lipase-like [Plodia interpunctella]
MVIEGKMNALLSVLVVCSLGWASGYNLGPTDVVFHFYSQSNPTTSQVLLPSVSSISASSFSNNRRTVFTIHNHGESVAGNFNAFVVPAHLSVEDVNLIAVDWSVGASAYVEGLANAPEVGERVATFINLLLTNFNSNEETFRIVGVGLGAQIAGIAAKNSVRPLPHIIGLDPSLFGWTHHPDLLNADDAGVVEVLHTTSGVLGYDYPLGDLDFYPNGGAYQNGCFVDVACSHIYSYAFYSESITREVNGGNEFIGTECEDYESARALSCEGERDISFGGTEPKTNVSGIYTFLTNPTVPFAQG